MPYLETIVPNVICLQESRGTLQDCTYCLDASSIELISHWAPRRALVVVSVKEETHAKQIKIKSKNEFQEESKSLVVFIGREYSKIRDV